MASNITRTTLTVAYLLSTVACSSEEKDEQPVTAATVGTPQTVQSGFGFTEGPAVDKAGNVFFTDQPNDKIHKWDATTGSVTTFLEGTGRANGLAFDKDGYLIACADEYGEVWRIAPDGSHEVLVDNFERKLLNGPNDVWINPVNGGMYITDPMFPRDYWDAADPRKQEWPPTHSEQAATGKGGHVYYLAPGATALVRVTTMPEWETDVWPNGVVGTPDGKKLYVNRWTDDSLGGTLSFDIQPDGSLSNLEQFAAAGGDGMSMDAQGNVYISNGKGVQVIDPDGQELFTIPTEAGEKKGATNNVFAGTDEKTLFITGPSDRITTVKVTVSGVEKY
jgi:gluconolactonase